MKSDMVAHPSTSDTQEVEAKGSQVQGYLWSHSSRPAPEVVSERKEGRRECWFVGVFQWWSLPTNADTYRHACARIDFWYTVALSCPPADLMNVFCFAAA